MDVLCGCFLITSEQKQCAQTLLRLGCWLLAKPFELWGGYMAQEGKKCVYKGCRAAKLISTCNLVQAFSNEAS